jgi:hypothetical protein
MGDLSASYFMPPKTLPGFPRAKRSKRISDRKRWINDDGDILEWDYQTGKVERYDDRGRHKGEFDPNDGSGTKPASPKRWITPEILQWGMTTVATARNGYQLVWFNRVCRNREDEIAVGTLVVPATTEREVQRVFAPDVGGEFGDCFGVLDRHADWLKAKNGVSTDLEKFDYFVERFAE